MGEYVKYGNTQIKLGTCEDLYYVTYQQYRDMLSKGLLSKLEGNLAPKEYARPDSGFRFRFPFPDEDQLPFGDIGKFEFCRGVPIKIDKLVIPNDDFKLSDSSFYEMDIVQQKLITRASDKKICLALVCRDSKHGNLCRIEDDDTMYKIYSQILKNHIWPAGDEATRSFYKKLARRMLAGYRLDQRSHITEREHYIRSTSSHVYTKARGIR